MCINILSQSVSLVVNVEVQMSKFESQTQWFPKDSVPCFRTIPLCSFCSSWLWCWTTIWLLTQIYALDNKGRKIKTKLLLEFIFGLFKAFSSGWFIFFVCLFYFILFFYFTILYWFCHTLTWFRHRCTWVPNPEPPFLALSPYHLSGSSQCTSPKHPVSCIEPRCGIYL